MVLRPLSLYLSQKHWHDWSISCSDSFLPTERRRTISRCLPKFWWSGLNHWYQTSKGIPYKNQHSFTRAYPSKGISHWWWYIAKQWAPQCWNTHSKPNLLQIQDWCFTSQICPSAFWVPHNVDNFCSYRKGKLVSSNYGKELPSLLGIGCKWSNIYSKSILKMHTQFFNLPTNKGFNLLSRAAPENAKENTKEMLKRLQKSVLAVNSFLLNHDDFKYAFLDT